MDNDLRELFKKELFDKIFWLLESSNNISYNEILEMSYPAFNDLIKAKSDLEENKGRKLQEHVKEQLNKHRTDEAKRKHNYRIKERAQKEQQYRYKK